MDTDTLSLNLVGGMQVVEEIDIPPDDLVESWGDDEQLAIQYAMDFARGRRGATQEALAAQACMHKSQWSLLYYGRRGIPVGRFLSFTRATKSAAVLKLYANRIGCVLKPKREWGKKIDEIEQLRRRVKELELENEQLQQRLAPYEDSACG